MKGNNGTDIQRFTPNPLRCWRNRSAPRTLLHFPGSMRVGRGGTTLSDAFCILHFFIDKTTPRHAQITKTKPSQIRKSTSSLLLVELLGTKGLIAFLGPVRVEGVTLSEAKWILSIHSRVTHQPQKQNKYVKFMDRSMTILCARTSVGGGRRDSD